MPKTGRTCVDGTIYLGGVPLHATDIARDPFHPVSTSRVADLLAGQTDLPIGQLTVKAIEAEASTARGDLRDARSRRRTHCRRRGRQSALVRLGAAACDRRSPPRWVQVGLPRLCAATLASEGHESGRPRPAIHKPIIAVMGSMAEISRRQTDHAG